MVWLGSIRYMYILMILNGLVLGSNYGFTVLKLRTNNQTIIIGS